MKKPIYHKRGVKRRVLRLPFVMRRDYDLLRGRLESCQMEKARLIGEAAQAREALARMAERFVGITFPDPAKGVLEVQVQMAPEILMAAFDERAAISIAVEAKVRQEIMTTRLLPFPVRA